MSEERNHLEWQNLPGLGFFLRISNSFSTSLPTPKRQIFLRQGWNCLIVTSAPTASITSSALVNIGDLWLLLLIFLLVFGCQCLTSVIVLRSYPRIRRWIITASLFSKELSSIFQEREQHFKQQVTRERKLKQELEQQFITCQLKLEDNQRELSRERELKEGLEQQLVACQLENEQSKQKLSAVSKELSKCKAGCCAARRGMVGGVIFQYELRNDVWESMSSDRAEELLEKYIDYRTKASVRCFSFSAAGNMYDIDFQDMTQTNRRTSTVRKIRYKFNIPPNWEATDDEIMKMKCREQDVTMSPNVSNVRVEIVDTSQLHLFTMFLKASVYHHGPAQVGSHCEVVTANMHVMRAWRVENWPLWQSYSDFRRGLLEEFSDRGINPQSIDPPLEPVQNKLLSEQCHVRQEVNEVLLLHGSTASAVDRIVSSGFDDRLARKGYYGYGTYFASQVCKSLQYCDTANNVAIILVSRVLVGDPWFVDKVESQLRRPPERPTISRVCDSVIARPGPMPGHRSGHQSHQEFVIFERLQAYPEYILEVSLP